MSNTRKSVKSTSKLKQSVPKKQAKVRLVNAQATLTPTPRMNALANVENPLSSALAALKKNPARAREIAINAGIITPKTHKLTKEYA